ncbi:MBL fold metallo-hydrolase [Jatrophihabitans fulvus]
MTTPATSDDRHAWERPGAEQVAPGVHRIPLPLPNDGLKAVNVYAIVDGDDVVCVDAGWALEESEQLLEKGLREVGFELGDVREFLCTHVHRDHYTQAVALRRRFGSRVALGEGERRNLELIRHRPDTHPDVPRLLEAGADELAELVRAWNGAADLSDWEQPDTWVADSTELPLRTRTLRAISTPGHTRGHLVFHDPDHGALFAGDHVLPHITPSIGVEFDRPPSPLRDYLSSLELVRALPDARLFPAHGPVTRSVHERIDELLAHHEQRLDETAGAVAKGAETGFEVARALGWTRRRRHFDDLDVFNQLLATQETVAHLLVLVERGRLKSMRIDGVARYSPA